MAVENRGRGPVRGDPGRGPPPSRDGAGGGARGHPGCRPGRAGGAPAAVVTGSQKITSEDSTRGEDRWDRRAPSRIGWSSKGRSGTSTAGSSSPVPTPRG